MRYAKAVITLVICITLVGLLIQQLPQFETAIVIVGFAAAIVLARWQIRKV